MARSSTKLAVNEGDDSYLYVPDEVVVPRWDGPKIQALDAPGFELVGELGGYAVYRLADPDRAAASREVVMTLGLRPHLGFGACNARAVSTADHAQATDEELPALAPDPPGLTVGVIDTGLVFDDTGRPHQWLASHVDCKLSDEDVLPPPEQALSDADCHGTFVSGLILQQDARIRVRMVRAFDLGLDDAESGGGPDLAVAEAIQLLACEGVKLLNLSFCGFPVESEPPPLLASVIAGLDSDTVVVAAAGNGRSSTRVYPAALPRVMAVGAVDDVDSFDLGTGLLPAPFSNFGEWVDVYAGGASMLGPYCVRDDTAGDRRTDRCRHDDDPRPQAFSGWARWSGTSYAAAVVTGQIASVAIRHYANDVVAAARHVLEHGRARTVIVDGIERPYVAGAHVAGRLPA